MSNAKQIIKRTAIYGAALVLYVLIISVLNIGCPIYAITRIECPTCGVTRAMISLLRLDFASYVNYQPFALPLIIAVCLMINVEFIKHKSFVTAISLAIVFANFVFYTIKMFY